MTFDLSPRGSLGPHCLMDLKLLPSSSDPPIVQYRPSKSIITDLPRFLPHERPPRFRMISIDAHPFWPPKSKLWPKTSFLPCLPIHPSNNSSDHTVAVFALSLTFFKKNVQKLHPKPPKKPSRNPSFDLFPSRPLMSRSTPKPFVKKLI